MPRIGSWIQTYTGIPFWPLDPRPEEIAIVDIAHALSQQCRFTGHCNVFYSVGEHSLWVSRLVSEEHALSGLLHDASEAYLMDLPRPLKNHSVLGALYKEAEAVLQKAICERFELPFPMPAEVGAVDDLMLSTELRDLMQVPRSPWETLPTPLGTCLRGKLITNPLEVEKQFLVRFLQYYKGNRE